MFDNNGLYLFNDAVFLVIEDLESEFVEFSPDGGELFRCWRGRELDFAEGDVGGMQAFCFDNLSDRIDTAVANHVLYVKVGHGCEGKADYRIAPRLTRCARTSRDWPSPPSPPGN